MGTGPTAAEICDRFLTEQRYVNDYVAFLDDHSRIAASDISKINQILKKFKLPTLWIPEKWLGRDHAYAAEHIPLLLKFISATAPAVEQTFEVHAASFQKLQKPKDLL